MKIEKMKKDKKFGIFSNFQKTNLDEINNLMIQITFQEKKRSLKMMKLI